MGVKRVAAAAGSCAIVATAGLAMSSGAQDVGPPTGTLELIQRGRDVAFRLNDVRPRETRRRPRSMGDTLVVRGPVRDRAGNRVGRAQAVFVATSGGAEVDTQLAATFVLGGGHIVVQGADVKGPVDTVAITGGTGRYIGANGTLELRPRDDDTVFRFTFAP
jgi:Dirigent-like protein